MTEKSRARNNFWPHALLFAALLTAGLASDTAADIATERMPLSFEVKPVTRMSIVNLATGRKAAEIGPLMMGTGAAENTLQITVDTNEGRSYQIFLETGDLRNPEGDLLGGDAIQFFVSSGRNGGESLVPRAVPLQSGRRAVFRSAPSGNADSFTVHILMPNTRVMDSGTYYDSLKFSIE